MADNLAVAREDVSVEAKKDEESQRLAQRRFEDVWGHLQWSKEIEGNAQQTLEALACAALHLRLETLIRPEHAPLLVVAWQLQRLVHAVEWSGEEMCHSLRRRR